MWYITIMKKKIKWILLGLVAFIFLLVFVGGGDSTETEQVEPNLQQEVQVQQEQADLAPEEQIKISIQSMLSGQNNLDQNRLESVEVTDIADGFRVEVGFNANDNFGNELIKSGMEKQMSEIYQELFTKYDNINEVSVGARFPLTDQYGNEKQSVVYYTTLTKEEAGKVNWNVDNTTLMLSILPGVWQTDILHPEFK